MSLFGINEGATGMFRHKETHCYFEFRPTHNHWALEQGMTHEVAVDARGFNGDQNYRYARVLKTVAHVLVDEDQIECWPIKIEWRNES